MSDSNLSDKIAESITNILKKTKVFEKIDEIQFYIGSFFLISSIYFTGNIVSKYYITKKQFNNNKTMIADIKDLKNNYILLHDDIKILHNKITELEIRLTTSLEDHNVLNIEKIDMISASTSLSSFTLDSSPKEVYTKNSDDDWHLSEKNDTFFEYI